MAGVQGFEPRLAEPKSAVLPLDDTPIQNTPMQIVYHLQVVYHRSGEQTRVY